MSEENKAVFRDHFEQIWNAKDPSAIERFIARDYEGYDAAEPIVGIEGYKLHYLTLTTAFPDLRLGIEIIMAEGDRVAARYLAVGTHLGRLGDIPPTRLRVSITGTAIARISRGKLAQEHANADTLGLLKQIGVVPGTVRAVPLLF